MLNTRNGAFCLLFITLTVAAFSAWPHCADAQFGRRGAGMMSNSESGPSSTPRRSTPYFRPASDVQVREVRIRGNRNVTQDKVRSHLKTRVDRVFDPARVQADVHALISTGLFRDVKTYTEKVQGGIAVTFEVFERPTIGYVRFDGRDDVKEKTLLRESGLKVGDPLNGFAVREARRKIEEYYRTKGFGKAQITVLEGTETQHGGVVFQINEGPKQRIWRTIFIGNTLASDRRLKTQIQSKPGILWVFKGKVDERKIEEDEQRLTAYYRSLGYFKAKVSRELEYDDDNEWLTLTFIIDEGPRYEVRDVRVIGNVKYSSDDLKSRLELTPGEPFNLAKLRRDENMLRDIYGSQGHIAAQIKAAPRFLEEPGKLDLVYEIQEGDQYRVGRIFVNIEGEHSHTRQTVVLNRLSIKSGDIVDIREVRNSERRLKASQLFLTDPAQGIAPEIVVKPSALPAGAASIAHQPRGRPSSGGTIRGQSPDTKTPPRRTNSPTLYHRAFRPLVDLHVNVKPRPDETGSAP